ncbi:MAG: radical SAM protein [Myxococcota bacterium]|nr:radical SAM protein [Myxococcota bacterium]
MKPWIGPNNQIMRRLELHLTYHCPERCIFCSEEHRMKRFRSFPVTWGRVARTLRLHAERGVQNVHFTGGEPTIHPRFVDALQLAKKLGMRTSIGTIGTMLSREDFARKALPYLDEALFSIHGHTEELHDSLARRQGSFARVTGAMKTVLRLKPSFGAFANVVVTRQNVDSLAEILSFVENLGARLIVVSNTTPEGGGGDHYEELAVPLAKLKEEVPRAAANVQRAVLRFFGMPMCVLGEYHMLSNDLHWDPRVTVEWMAKPGSVAFDGLYSWAPDRKRVHVDSCGGCIKNKLCMGVFDKYAQLWHTEDLAPYIKRSP